MKMTQTIPDLCCSVSSLPNTYTKVFFILSVPCYLTIFTATVLTKRSQKQHFTAQNITVQECTVCLAANHANAVAPFTATASIPYKHTHTTSAPHARPPHTHLRKNTHKHELDTDTQ